MRMRIEIHKDIIRQVERCTNFYVNNQWVIEESQN